MKKVLLATIAAVTMSSAAVAGDVETGMTYSPIVGGSIELEVAENSAGDFAATTTFSADIVAQGLGFGEISVESLDGSSFEVNKWYLGVLVGNHGFVSFGDHDGGIFVESYSDYSTIAEPVMEESLILSYGNASAALGFTDISSDVTDVSNMQAAYTVDAGIATVTVSADYNFNTEEYAVGTRTDGVLVGPVVLGSTTSYESATETFAYELDAGLSFGLTAYVNGDDSDAFRNVGAEYTRDIDNLTVFASVNYDVNAEEFNPEVGVTLNF